MNTHKPSLAALMVIHRINSMQIAAVCKVGVLQIERMRLGKAIPQADAENILEGFNHLAKKNFTLDQITVVLIEEGKQHSC